MSSARETRLIEMIFPERANHYGTLFGGHALSLMAKVAFMEATRHAGTSVVMARSEHVDFSSPVRVGEILELVARVSGTGRSSMTVDVEGYARSIGGTCARIALSGRFKMVAVDAEGCPRPVGQENSPTRNVT